MLNATERFCENIEEECMIFNPARKDYLSRMLKSVSKEPDENRGEGERAF